MIAPLLEKLQRHDALTTDEAANAMAAIMRGEVTPAQIAGLLMALRSKGERPEELVGLARAMRAAAVPLPRHVHRCVRHLRHGRRQPRHGERLVDGRGGRRRVRRARRQARQPFGLEPQRQRRRVRGARRQRGRHAGGGRALPRGSGHRVPVRADVPSVDAPRRAGATRTRRADGVQPPRPADQSGRHDAAAGRRAPAGTHRVGGALARPAGVGARVGRACAPMASTNSRRPATRRCPSAATACCVPSSCTRRCSACRRPRWTTYAAATRRTTRRSRARCWTEKPGPVRDVVLLNAGAGLLVAGRCRHGAARRDHGRRGHRQRPRVARPRASRGGVARPEVASA